MLTYSHTDKLGAEGARLAEPTLCVSTLSSNHQLCLDLWCIASPLFQSMLRPNSAAHSQLNSHSFNRLHTLWQPISPIYL